MKQYLHGFLIKHSNTLEEKVTCPSIVIPLELRCLYKMTDLEIVKHFDVKLLSVELDETKNTDKRLPISKNLIPVHGIVEDLFVDGYPGLVQS